MNDEKSAGRGGWRIGRYLPIELDVALSLTTGYFAVSGLDEVFGDLIGGLAADWKAEGRQLIGGEPRIVSLIELATQCSRTTFEADYGSALLPVRSLDPAGAVELLTAAGGASAVEVPRDREEAVRVLADILVERQRTAYDSAGLALEAEAPQVAATREEALRLGRVLEGGELHERFWHWLDRFYYQWYQPWRESRQGVMEEGERRALMMLGAQQSDEGPADLSWLPAQNPVRMLPELGRAVGEGRLRLYLWVEPFGFADLMIVRPREICLSFGEPGRIYAEFRRHAAHVASRAKALGDPTRLLMLRLIRHFPMMNTELAEYLDIARPTASIHAKLLREAGLITSRQDGHSVRHEIRRSEIRRLFEDLNRLLDLGPADSDPTGRS